MIDGTTVTCGSPYEPAWAPSVTKLFSSRVVLSDLADISDPAKFSGALQYALDSGYHKIIIPGRDTRWQMSASVTLPMRPFWIEGEGCSGRSMSGGTLIEYTGSGRAFQGTSGSKGAHISNLKLERSGYNDGLASPDKIGIEFPGLVEDCHLENLWIAGFYNNIKGGATSYSYVHNVVSDAPTHAGILFANNSTANGLQWTLERCLFQRSGNSGCLWDTVDGTGPTSVGEMINCNSYANSRYGVEFTDTVISKLTGVRMNGGFFGEDKLGGIHIKSHRGLHKIVGVECEIAGTAWTGPPTGQEAPSNAGKGIFLERPSSYVNGVDFNSATIDASIIAFNTRSGVYSQFALTTIAGCEFRGNGQANIAGDRSNIQLEGIGTSVKSKIGGNSIIAAKGWGIFAQNDNHSWTDNVMGGNAGGTTLANAEGMISTNGTGLTNGVYTGNM